VRSSADTVVKDLVLVGGGHSHVAVLKRFGMAPMPGVRLTLIARDVHTPYSGMLPGFVAGHYGFDDMHVDLGPLARFAGARLYHDETVGLDLAARKVICRDRPPVAYDILSINVGSAPSTAGVPGAEGRVVPVKPINTFLERWQAMHGRVLARKDLTRIGVVGAGAGGVELLLAARHRLRQAFAAGGRDVGSLEFHIVADTDEVLPAFNPTTRAKMARILKDTGVRLHLGRPAVAVEDGGVRLADGSLVLLDEILWVTAAGAQPWLKGSGLEVDDAGFVKLRGTLESVSHPGVFAAGDIAAVVDHPRPKAGVFAVRQGPALAENLRRAAAGRPPKPFRPQRQYLAIISTGDKYAVATRGTLAAEGRWVWRWKDWIDRRWMRKYNELPAMAATAATNVAPGVADAQTLKEISAIAMRCGGCGAKVGGDALSRALAQVETVKRDDVLVGLDAPDDAAVVAVPAGKAMVHTVDFFRAFVEDPYVFAQVAANHALGDIYAMGAEPQTALAIATIPYGLEAKVEDQLATLMQGATKVLSKAGCALVGGHTSEGAELALGFAINGLADHNRILTKGGMRPGDRLILTKPLGTGTLFAADMRARARGRWVQAALESMIQSNRDAARALMASGATACTDVTGFGLLGHLVEMTRASGVDATVELAALPLLDGALECVHLGIFSSLQPANVRLRRAIKDQDRIAAHELYPLLFDPQTAGGLLASVPADRADACLAELRRSGYRRAAIVGAVAARSDVPEPITLVG